MFYAIRPLIYGFFKGKSFFTNLGVVEIVFMAPGFWSHIDEVHRNIPRFSTNGKHETSHNYRIAS